MPDSFEFDPAPSATKPTHEYGTPVGTAGYQDQFLTEVVQELLASTVAYRQRGVTLAGGQGVLPTGCVLAQNTTTGLYYVHTLSAAVERDATSRSASCAIPATPARTACPPNAMGNLVWSGALNASLISGTDTTSLVTGFGGGIGSGATPALTVAADQGPADGRQRHPGRRARSPVPRSTAAKITFSYSDWALPGNQSGASGQPGRGLRHVAVK